MVARPNLNTLTREKLIERQTREREFARRVRTFFYTALGKIFNRTFAGTSSETRRTRRTEHTVG